MFKLRINICITRITVEEGPWKCKQTAAVDTEDNTQSFPDGAMFVAVSHWSFTPVIRCLLENN